MPQWFFRLLPYVGGVVMGLLLVPLSRLFPGLGAIRPLVLMALASVALLAFIAFQLVVLMPADIAIEPFTDVAPDEVHSLLQIYRSLGFDACGDPLVVRLRPAGVVWTLVHRELGCAGTVFATCTIPRKVGHDFISVIDGGGAALTSVGDPGSAVLPHSPGSFKQVLRGASPQALLAHHMRAHAYLEQRGVRFVTLPESGAADRLQASLARQRQVVLRKPLRVAALAVWRSMTGSTPYGAPIAKQKSTEAALRNLRSEAGRPAS